MVGVVLCCRRSLRWLESDHDDNRARDLLVSESVVVHGVVVNAAMR